MTHAKPLGRRVPATDEHVRKHPLTLDSIVATVNKTMPLPWWHWLHNQGNEGACVGHGTAMERAIREKFEREASGVKPATIRLDPWWYWDMAKRLDEWSDTNPGDDNGTSVHAAYDAVRRYGGVKIANSTMELGYPGTAKVAAGTHSAEFAVQANVWATSVDAMRTCIARDQPITIGVNWYAGFDDPIQRPAAGGFYIPTTNLGSIRGGHCVCIYGASDLLQAFRVKNSWGRSYPLVWLPYAVMDKLLAEDGEATVVTDSR